MSMSLAVDSQVLKAPLRLDNSDLFNNFENL